MNVEVLTNQILELRRGSIVLATLAVVNRQPYYGYALLNALKANSFDVDGSTLYPLLRRLERQGALKSEWDTADNRPRKYYSLTDDGRTLYKALIKEWSAVHDNVSNILKEQ